MRLLSGLSVLALVACGGSPAPRPAVVTPSPVASAPDPELDRLLSAEGSPRSGPALPPPRTAAVRIRDEAPAPRYRGRRIDLDVKNAEVTEVLRLLADVGHVNMIVADDVKGTITLRLRQVPWDQALEVIAKAKGLGVEEDGNLITVGSVVYPPAH